MPYTDILNVILPTFITILIGFVIGKIIRIDLDGVIDLIFYVGLPVLAFVSILNQQIVLLDAAKVWVSAILVSLGCGALGWLLFKALKSRHPGLLLPISLPNTVNIPFPIVSLAYGPVGLFIATLYYIPNIFLIYSAGVFIAAGKNWRDNLIAVLKVPTFYSVILALIFNFCKISMPQLIMKPLDFIGGMVTPALVLTLGFSLSKVKITSLPVTLWASLIRLGGGLAIGLLVVYLFDITGITRSVVVLMSAMPSAVNTYTIAAKYKNEPELVASVVMVTTVISLVLIPFLLYWLG
jgi:malate permease and related proteins